MARIVMLLSNPYRPDPRVQREAQSLAKAGHMVTLLCWDRQSELPSLEQQENFEIIRLQTVKSSYAAGWRQLFYLPRFWQAVEKQALSLQPDVIHCHDLDTLSAGWRIKARLRAAGKLSALVFDAHEDYPALMSLYLPRLLVELLHRYEHVYLRKVDAIITASQVLAEKYANQLAKDNRQSPIPPPIRIVGNYQTLAPFDVISPELISATRQKLGVNPNDYVIAYIGGFIRNRELLPLVEATRGLPGVKVFLWGDGPQRTVLETAIAGAENIKYMGWLPSEQVSLHFRLADVIYYCLNANYPGAIYNAPNTMSNAMAAGKPIIANRVGDLGKVIEQVQCGILLPEVSPVEIGFAIERLRDPVFRSSLGANGRRAAETIYNWSIAEKVLLELYERLLPGKA